MTPGHLWSWESNGNMFSLDCFMQQKSAPMRVKKEFVEKRLLCDANNIKIWYDGADGREAASYLCDPKFESHRFLVYYIRGIFLDCGSHQSTCRQGSTVWSFTLKHFKTRFFQQPLLTKFISRWKLMTSETPVFYFDLNRVS